MNPTIAGAGSKGPAPVSVSAEDIRALEAVAAKAWPAREEAWLGGWRLRATDGWTGRANSCWPLAAPDREVEATIFAAEAWYAQRGLTCVFRTVDGATTPGDLEVALSARGYRAEIETSVMLGPLPPPDAQADEVRLAARPDAAFREVLFGVAHRGDGDAAERWDVLNRIAAPVNFATAWVDGVAAAVGCGAVADGWAGLSAMRTLEPHRRRGLARRVAQALLAAGREAGAERAYLQVEAENVGATALYEELGFRRAYGYRHWRR